MALVLSDRVRVSSVTTGTGALALGVAIPGFQDFTVIGDGNTTFYTIADSTAGTWETGIGTYSSTGPTLARTTVLESSNAGALVNFGVGAKDVFVSYPASRAVSTDGGVAFANAVSVPSGASGAQVPQSQETAMLATTQLAGNRNIVINGACQIAQRANSVISTTSGTYGGPDRYFGTVTSGSLTQSASSLDFGGRTIPAIRQTVGVAPTSIAAGDYWGGINQCIESANCFHVRGREVVLSFIFNTNVAGTYSISVRVYRAPTHSFVAAFTVAANTPTRIEIPVAAVPSAATALTCTNLSGIYLNVGFLNTGTYEAPSTDAWISGNYHTAAAAASTNWAATAGNFIELTELQLELGTVATPFEYRMNELQLCQRYYEVLEGRIVGTYASSGSSYVHWPFKVTKRTSTPTYIAGGGSSGIIEFVSASGSTAYMDSPAYAIYGAGSTVSAEF